ncbi:hypothetical protein CU098_006714, partial [Rhizopus stolonifer]
AHTQKEMGTYKKQLKQLTTQLHGEAEVVLFNELIAQIENKLEEDRQASFSDYFRSRCEASTDRLPSLVKSPLGKNSSDVVIVNENCFMGSLTSLSVKYPVSVYYSFVLFENF